MGFAVSVADIIQSVREAVLPANFHEHTYKDGVFSDPGIIFQFDVSLNHHTGNESYGRRCMVYVALCGNTSVWIAIEPDTARWLQWTDVPVEAWENTSNHDSCWRSDGLSSPLSKLYFSFSHKINKEMEADGLESIAPVMMHQHCMMGFIGNKPWELVTISYSREDENYRRKIIKIESKGS